MFWLKQQHFPLIISRYLCIVCTRWRSPPKRNRFWNRNRWELGTREKAGRHCEELSPLAVVVHVCTHPPSHPRKMLFILSRAQACRRIFVKSSKTMCPDGFSEINYFKGISFKEEKLTTIYHGYSMRRHLRCENGSAAGKTQIPPLKYVGEF